MTMAPTIRMIRPARFDAKIKRAMREPNKRPLHHFKLRLFCAVAMSQSRLPKLNLSRLQQLS